MTPNDVKIIADNIDDFIEVPDGVVRLRKAVLTLAVSGKLAPQDKKEGTAEELYAQILLERAEDSTGRKKKTSNLTPLSLDEIPFEIPTSWKWVRIREITHDCGQKTPDTDFCYVDVSSIDSSRGVIVEPKYLKASEAPSRARKRVEDKSVIYSGVRPYLLNTAVIDLSVFEGEVIASTAFFVLKPYANVSSEYIHLMVRSPYFDELANRACVGAAYPAINDDKFEKLLVPLPPLQEQKRIVERVKEVMKQLDDLEIKKKERDEVRTRLTLSAMQSLGQGNSKVAFEHLVELIKTSADIKELEGAFITLAVSGKLVQQDKKDGTAESLLKQIQSKRTKIKKWVEIEEKDKLFPIPSNWVWARLEDVFDVRDGTHDSPKYHSDGYPLVTSKNLYHGSLDFLNVKYISEADHKKISERSKVDRDDVLFAMIGSIGNPVVVDTDTKFSIKNVALFKYYDRKLSEPMFLLTYLKYAAQNMRAISAGGVQSFVSLGFLRGYPFPLPPLAEQKRIVKKVAELMVLINKLKESI